MTKLERNVKKCSEESYDLIIVGGGIYGIMLSYEAARRNLRSLMLEKSDFSSVTSLNHLRTVHGGFRYLQTLDIKRFKESVGERKWFLKYFPQFVHKMPCLMPLYNKGVYRTYILRPGLLANDMLSFYRNFSVEKERHLPNGRVVSPRRTREIFPGVDPEGLKGSAVWYDASVEEYQRLIMELLKLAVTSGATALNYMNVKGLLKEKNNAIGVRAMDEETGEEYEFKAPVVINAAGPWNRDVAAQFHKDHEPLFKKRLLLWNVLLNREALSDYALGLMPIKGKGHTYFFHPWKNRLLVGTGEVVVKKSEKETNVPQEEMEHFIKDINRMAPELKVTEADIQRVYSGILPAEENGKLSNREVIFDHSTQNGPKGLFSISGVKFTTSRLVADKILTRIFPKAEKHTHKKISEQMQSKYISFDYDWEPSTKDDLNLLKEIIENESVRHLSDLILRRTSLGDHPERALKIFPKIKPIFDWDDKKWENEMKEFTFASGGQGLF
jgi:glycerol-3-phosphate dehydrogenase